MKKFIIAVLLTIITFASCEKDDICLEDTTPNLIIRFYDIDNPTELKKVESLTVWSVGYDSIYRNLQLDSIIIPLNINTNNTIYKFRSENTIDEISLTYQKNDIFVSRSCGYKTNYTNIEIESSTNWVKGTIINNTTIENEKAAHITIFH